MVPENIHNPPTEGIRNSGEERGSQIPKNLKECMKLNWNFRRVGGVIGQIPSVAGGGGGGGGGDEYFLEPHNLKHKFHFWNITILTQNISSSINYCCINNSYENITKSILRYIN